MAERKTCMTLSLGDETIAKLKKMAQENGRSYTAEMAILINNAYSKQVDERPVPKQDVSADMEAPF